MTVKFKKRLRITLAAVCALVAVVLSGWVFAPTFLAVDSGPQTADALVVLGGEPQTRPNRAAEVFQETQPSLVIVSGNGDCQDVRRQMEAHGVTASVIVTECKSRNTKENAAFSVKLLRERGITNAVIVTSWFHSRRALACFQTAAPEIHFSARPTPCPPAGLRHPDSYIAKRAFQEYAKIVYYWLIHGVSSW